jgi:hypothetical protein
MNDCPVMFGSQYASAEKTGIYRCANKRWEGYDINPHPRARKTAPIPASRAWPLTDEL